MTLVQLSRGIYPSLLGTHGVVPALRAVVAGSGQPIEVVESRVGRYDANVEAAAWCDDLARALRAGATLGRAIVEVTGEHPVVAERVDSLELRLLPAP